MAGFEDEGGECWYCQSRNTTLWGFTKGPKEMHFSCKDCGLIAHHDGENDVYSDNKDGINNPMFYKEG
jgi:hypothetical protein